MNLKHKILLNGWKIQYGNMDDHRVEIEIGYPDGKCDYFQYYITGDTGVYHELVNVNPDRHVVLQHVLNYSHKLPSYMPSMMA